MTMKSDELFRYRFINNKDTSEKVETTLSRYINPLNHNLCFNSLQLNQYLM